MLLGPVVSLNGIEPEQESVQQPGYRALFRVAGFRRLFASALAARVGTQMSSVLLVLFVLETHHSAELSGLVVVASQVPGILASPFAGVLLDRGARPRLMRIDFLVGSLAMGLLGALALLGSLPTPILLLIVSLASITAPLSRVGGRSLYAIMLPRELWDYSNAADSGTWVIATVMGPSVAGVAVAVVGPRAALLLPAVVLCVAGILLVRLVVPDLVSSSEGSIFVDAWAAITYVWRNRVLRMIAGTMTVFNACAGILTVSIPFIVLRDLHGGSKTVGLLFAIMGASGFLAGVLTGGFGTENREKRLLAASCMVTGVAFLALVFNRTELILFLLIAVIGAANGPLTVAMMSLRVRATEPRWFGRAFAVSMNLNFTGSPIGALIAGALLSHSVAVTLLVAATCAVTGGLWPAVLPASSYEPVTA